VNGYTAGLVADDHSGALDSGRSHRSPKECIEAALKALSTCTRQEAQQARQCLEEGLAACEGQRSGEEVDGEDSKNAQVERASDIYT